MEHNNNQLDNRQQGYYDINNLNHFEPFPKRPENTFMNYHDFKYKSAINQNQGLTQLIIQPRQQALNPGSQWQNQPQLKVEPLNEYKDQLKSAYDIYLIGNKHYKGLDFHIALDSYEKALVIVNRVYPNIVNDPKLKSTTDQFLKSLNQTIESTKVQIKSRFEYKSNVVPSKESNFNFAKSVICQDTNKNDQKQQPRYVVREIKEKQNQINYQPTPKPTITSNKEIGNSKNKNQKKDTETIGGDDIRSKVLSEIIDTKPGISFGDVIGLGAAKQILKEIIIIPNLRPDLFTGLRAPPRGLLLFGPPGTGKTMIAKAVATECKCTFFNISASSLTSKYVGESEKLVRALFEIANEKEPSVVFIDEIESILSKRNENENEAMKRLKTEFLIQFDGVGSNQKSHVLIIGATNRPQDLDPAVIRRLPKRVYIGPFDEQDRKKFVTTIIKQNDCVITDEEFNEIARRCTNYSNSDLKELCREAAYEPLREISGNIEKFQSVNQLRAICFEDFNKAIKKVRGTLTQVVLNEMENWNKQFGALN